MIFYGSAKMFLVELRTSTPVFQGVFFSYLAYWLVVVVLFVSLVGLKHILDFLLLLANFPSFRHLSASNVELKTDDYIVTFLGFWGSWLSKTTLITGGLAHLCCDFPFNDRWSLGKGFDFMPWSLFFKPNSNNFAMFVFPFGCFA